MVFVWHRKPWQLFRFIQYQKMLKVIFHTVKELWLMKKWKKKFVNKHRNIEANPLFSQSCNLYHYITHPMKCKIRNCTSRELCSWIHSFIKTKDQLLFQDISVLNTVFYQSFMCYSHAVNLTAKCPCRL